MCFLNLFGRKIWVEKLDGIILHTALFGTGCCNEIRKKLLINANGSFMWKDCGMLNEKI